MAENISNKLERAYYDTIYRVSKATFQPVVAAMRDVIEESFEPASPTDFVGSFLRWLGRR